MWFHSWGDLAHVLGVGAAAYVALVVMLRVSGARTLSKFNAFDLVVTVALGSTLASALLDTQVALAEAVLAFALLVALQFAVTWTTSRWRPFRRLVKSEPTLLVRAGRLLPGALREARLSHDEVLAALRDAGCPSVAQAQAVVLESNGSITVLTDVRQGEGSSVEDVPRGSDG